MHAEETGHPLVRISFPPGFEFVEPIRTFMSSYLEKRLSAQAAERAVTAAHELLENAAKFGSIAAEVVIEVRQPTEDDPIEICVTNAAFEPKRRALLERLQELRSRSPEEAYARAIADSSALGLARVLFESNMELDASVTGDIVTMRATFRAEPPQP